MESRLQSFFMKEALREANDAAIINEVPIGAIVVYKGKIIGRGHNLREHTQDVTSHAEILAIQEACAYLHSWRLSNCDLYVTVEPCLMCSGAIINSRIYHLYYGTGDPKSGGVHSLYNLLNDSRLNHQVEVTSGLYKKESSFKMKHFFKQARKRKKLKKARQKGKNKLL